MVQINQPRNIMEWINSEDRDTYKRRYYDKITIDLADTANVTIATVESWFRFNRSPNKDIRGVVEAYLSELTGIPKEDLFRRFKDDAQAPA